MLQMNKLSQNSTLINKSTARRKRGEILIVQGDFNAKVRKVVDKATEEFRYEE